MSEPGRIFAPIFSETIRQLCIVADKEKVDRNDFIKAYCDMVRLAVSITDFREYKI